MKRSISTPILFLVVLLWGLFACEEAVEWDFQEGENGVLVVDAILTNEFVQQTLRLSLSYDALNGSAPPVTDAIVSVTANDVSYFFAPVADDPGRYESTLPFTVFDDLTYELEVNWEGQRFTASSQLSEVAPFPEINFLPFKDTDSLFFGTFAPIYNANQQAMYEMNVDWTHLSADSEGRAKLLFFTFSTINTGGLVRPAGDTISFPKGSIVTAKKYGLNQDFADYLRALALETSWRGSVFYGPAASLPTNVSGGALGFFSTCAVLTDTLIAQ
ncbi:MAG: DUF4249 family protein [Saprospiraceae bacterium]|nr:DUF4249 family protein [Saprospiraceae bacterium]